MAKTVRKSRSRSRNQNRRRTTHRVRKNKTKKVGGAPGFFGSSSPSPSPSSPPSPSSSSSFLSKLPPGIASPQTLATLQRVAAENPNAIASLKGNLSALAPHVQKLANDASPMAKQLANTAIQNAPLTPAQRYAAEAAANAAAKLGPAALGMALKNPEGAARLGANAYNLVKGSGNFKF